MDGVHVEVNSQSVTAHLKGLIFEGRESPSENKPSFLRR